MNYLAMLTEDEIRYVCSVIPLSDSVGYFKHNPKYFSKVMPGFRPTSLKSQEQVGGVLFRSRNQHFISSFIEKHISIWLDEIDAAINAEISDGASKEIALLNTLPYCFFVDNIGLYFKLTGDEYSEEYVSLLSESIKAIKDAVKECESAKSEMKAKTETITRLESQLERASNEQLKMKRKLIEMSDEIKALKRTNEDFEKNKAQIALLTQEVLSFKGKAQEREDYIVQLKADLSSAKDKQTQLESKIRDEIANREVIVRQNKSGCSHSKVPKDIDEFKDYLGYNFENIGVSSASDYFVLLKEYISEILFQGKPIIISRSTGLTLMKCVSNALIKTPMVATLEYAPGLTEKSIDDFLSQSGRVLCLDNFIGNYNETMLVTICGKHRDKIIFMTTVYDRTLAFVSEELLKYCYYLNLNRIKAFSVETELTEDPSVVDEVDACIVPSVPANRWSSELSVILEELGIQGALAVYKSVLVTDEEALCKLLAFDILPYCTDVLTIAPFSNSERLHKYAGNNGRCAHKNLFERWFS